MLCVPIWSHPFTQQVATGVTEDSGQAPRSLHPLQRNGGPVGWGRETDACSGVFCEKADLATSGILQKCFMPVPESARAL